MSNSVSKVIWKFQLQLDSRQTVSMPHGAQILDVQARECHITLWAVVQPDNVNEPRLFVIVCTGESAELDPLVYMGTVQLGQLVYHVFEDLQ